jgi:hypothetical protein
MGGHFMKPLSCDHKFSGCNIRVLRKNPPVAGWQTVIVAAICITKQEPEPTH